jgi:hypothetical protein
VAYLLLTELRSTGSLFAGKQILCDNQIKSAPEDIKRWWHRRIEFDHIAEFYQYMLEMQYQNAVIVRGLTEATDEKIYRRKKCNEHPENVLHDHSPPLLVFDIDDAAVPATEWMADPRAAVDRYVVQKLGPAFNETSYVAQLTAPGHR